METTLVNEGKSLESKVSFASGLHPNNTVEKIKKSMKLWLIIADSRRLLSQEQTGS
jgi:hypothetical protein